MRHRNFQRFGVINQDQSFYSKGFSTSDSQVEESSNDESKFDED